MWGVSPKKLCNQRLLGEHLEMHMFLVCIKKGISLKGCSFAESRAKESGIKIVRK